MLDFDEFSSGKNWAFSESLNDGFIVSTSPSGEGKFQVMSRRQDGGTDYSYVDGVREAYTAAVASLAAYADRAAEPRAEGTWDVPITLAVERGGFKRGTFEPHGTTRYVASVFLSPARPEAMLLAAAPFYADRRGELASFVQVERLDGKWTIMDISPEFIEAVERGYCQWAKDALEIKGYTSESPSP